MLGRMILLVFFCWQCYVVLGCVNSPKSVRFSAENSIFTFPSPREIKPLAFRISPDSTHYFHDPDSDNHQIIQDRFKIYSLLFLFSKTIKNSNFEEFEKVLDENLDEVGFCMRFHLIIFVLNCYERGAIGSELLTQIIDRLAQVKTFEIPTDIVVDQYVDFSGKMALKIDTLMDQNLVSSLRKYSEIEYTKISLR